VDQPRPRAGHLSRFHQLVASLNVCGTVDSLRVRWRYRLGQQRLEVALHVRFGHGLTDGIEPIEGATEERISELV